MFLLFSHPAGSREISALLSVCERRRACASVGSSSPRRQCLAYYGFYQYLSQPAKAVFSLRTRTQLHKIYTITGNNKITTLCSNSSKILYRYLPVFTCGAVYSIYIILIYMMRIQREGGGQISALPLVYNVRKDQKNTLTHTHVHTHYLSYYIM